MSNGIYVRVLYRDEVCSEWKFRAINGDTIVISADDLVDAKVNEAIAAEREACAATAAWILKMPENDVSAAIRARGQG